MATGSYMHWYPDVPDGLTVNKYLSINSCASFKDNAGFPAKAGTSSLIIVLEQDRPLPADEVESLQELVINSLYMFQAWNLELDGLQIGFRNDPDGDVFWKRDDEHSNRCHISLCAESLRNWCQVIYQLGYSLAHCVLDAFRWRHHSDWVDETICETMSIWLLTMFMHHWEQCGLSGKDPKYADCINDYLHDFMTDQEWRNLPARCTSMKELVSMNTDAAANSAERVGTVIHLYYLIKPGDLKGLFMYSRYVPTPDGLINTEKWAEDYPENLAVRYIASLQDNAVKDDPEFIQFYLQNMRGPSEDWGDFFYSDDMDDD